VDQSRAPIGSLVHGRVGGLLYWNADAPSGDHSLTSRGENTPDEPAKNSKDHRTCGVELPVTGYEGTMKDIHDPADDADVARLVTERAV
jgi:hypothetical protein